MIKEIRGYIEDLEKTLSYMIGKEKEGNKNEHEFARLKDEIQYIQGKIAAYKEVIRMMEG